MDGGFQGSMGAILGMQARFGIPVLYVSKAEKRIKAIMVGWPTEGMGEKDAFPPLCIPCRAMCRVDHEHRRPSAFYVRNLWKSPRYKQAGLAGFGEDILEVWPDTEAIISLDENGKLVELWKAPEEVKDPLEVVN
jgi:hypothetical protein